MTAETQAFVRAHLHDDVRTLALRATPAGVDRTEALRQIAGWQTASHKLPRWAACEDVRYPVRLSMEQCSSQAAAEYKRRVVEELLEGARGVTGNIEGIESIEVIESIEGIENIESIEGIESIGDGDSLTVGSMADLTGGLGVDFSFLAPLFATATYVERNAELCELARHNMPLLLPPTGHTLYIYNKTAEEALEELPRQTLLFLDPARRDEAGRKVFLTADCQPDVASLHDKLVARADIVMLKLSPMLDIRDALRSLPATRWVHVVEVDGEVKELLLVLAAEPQDFCTEPQISCTEQQDCCTEPQNFCTEPRISCTEPQIVCTEQRISCTERRISCTEPRIVCTDTHRRFTFTFGEEAQAQPDYTSTIGTYLYEPSPAVMKAGAFRTLAVRYGLRKLHRDSHLYTSDTLVGDFPGRILEVLATAPMREAKTLLRDTRRANIVCRNFPLRPDELKRRLKIGDGGHEFLYATTAADGAHLLALCRQREK